MSRLRTMLATEDEDDNTTTAKPRLRVLPYIPRPVPPPPLTNQPITNQPASSSTTTTTTSSFQTSRPWRTTLSNNSRTINNNGGRSADIDRKQLLSTLGIIVGSILMGGAVYYIYRGWRRRKEDEVDKRKTLMIRKFITFLRNNHSIPDGTFPYMICPMYLRLYMNGKLRYLSSSRHSSLVYSSLQTTTDEEIWDLVILKMMARSKRDTKDKSDRGSSPQHLFMVQIQPRLSYEQQSSMTRSSTLTRSGNTTRLALSSHTLSLSTDAVQDMPLTTTGTSVYSSSSSFSSLSSSDVTRISSSTIWFIDPLQVYKNKITTEECFMVQFHPAKSHNRRKLKKGTLIPQQLQSETTIILPDYSRVLSITKSGNLILDRKNYTYNSECPTSSSSASKDHHESRFFIESAMFS